VREVLAAKIHNATVTEARLDYIGSITIDQDLLDKVDLWPGQKVLVVSNTSGARLETYIIPGERNSGVICMNGACAHLIKAKEEVIIMGFEMAQAPINPKCILVDENNRFKEDLMPKEKNISSWSSKSIASLIQEKV
jgi:aspartate 1-decarboxylase